MVVGWCRWGGDGGWFPLNAGGNASGTAVAARPVAGGCGRLVQSVCGPGIRIGWCVGLFLRDRLFVVIFAAISIHFRNVFDSITNHF